MREATDRRGGIAIIVGLSVVVLTMAMALALDVGYARAYQNQLHGATDAAALAGAAHLGDQSDVDAAAIAVAAENSVSGELVAITSADVEIGTYVAATDTFTLNPAGDSVRVSTDWDVPTLFSQIAGWTTLNVPRQSIAQAPPVQMQCNVFGNSSVTYSGSGMLDSYDRSTGVYGPMNNDEAAGACSNASVDVGGSSNVWGDAAHGEGEAVNISGSGDVSGRLAELTGPITEPNGNWDAVRAGTNDNPVIPPAGSYSTAAKASLPLNGAPSTVTLEPGTYWLDDLKITGSNVLAVSSAATRLNPVRIFVDGDASIAGQGIVNDDGSGVGDPGALEIYVAGDADLSGTSDFYGQIFVPDGTLKMRGTSSFLGLFSAENVDISGTGDVHVDTSLPNIPIATVRGVPRLVR